MTTNKNQIVKDEMKTFKEIINEATNPSTFKMAYNEYEKKLDSEINKMKSVMGGVLNKTGSAKDKESFAKYEKDIDKMISKIKRLEVSKYDKLQKFYMDYINKNK